jgi:uncharacterized damage-inducible protein DinB
MPIAQALVPEFDYEMATTRKMLERFPEDKTEWKPEETCMTLGRLAGHITELPGWVVPTINQDQLVMDGNFTPRVMTSRAESLKQFDETVAASRAALAGASDETLMKPWSLVVREKTVLTMPKVAVLRSFVMNHMIHHRGQLAAFYRIARVPVPSIYGPSKDEGTF